MAKSGELFSRFVEIIDQLRTPVTGCPWDLEQTHETLRQYLIEECYEVLDAIDNNDDREFATELGDVLLQVVLHSRIAAERQAFTIEEVVEIVSKKMINRHPHVFGDKKVTGTEEVLKNWEQIKLEEKVEGQKKEGVLDGVPRAMPALLRARRLGDKASKVNFDWSAIDGVWAKVKEEFAELEAEYLAMKDNPAGDKGRITEELGDLLFSLSQLARWLDVNPEDTLHRTCHKFTERFRLMEKLVGKPLAELSEEEWDQAWNEAKSSASSAK